MILSQQLNYFYSKFKPKYVKPTVWAKKQYAAIYVVFRDCDQLRMVWTNLHYRRYSFIHTSYAYALCYQYIDKPILEKKTRVFIQLVWCVVTVSHGIIVEWRNKWNLSSAERGIFVFLFNWNVNSFHFVLFYSFKRGSIGSKNNPIQMVWSNPVISLLRKLFVLSRNAYAIRSNTTNIIYDASASVMISQQSSDDVSPEQLKPLCSPSSRRAFWVVKFDRIAHGYTGLYDRDH